MASVVDARQAATSAGAAGPKPEDAVGDGISISYMDQFGYGSTVDVQLASGPPQ